MISFNLLTQKELQQILFELDQTLYNLSQWHNTLIRALIYRVPGDNDLLPDAHKRCRFCQWYYHEIPKEIQAHEGIKKIGELHQRMHQLTTQLLEKTQTSEGVTPLDYDPFTHAMEQMRLELSALKSELEYLIHSRDVLTGALSRATMLSTLREQQEFIKRQGQNCCLIMIDLDHFKAINEGYGPQVGDRILTTVARFFIENLRVYDKVFRYGGEEFLICLPFTELDIGKKMCDRLRKGLEAISINENSSVIKITASFGLTLLRPNKSIEESIDQANKALSLAKSEGRNCVRTWEE